MIRKKHFEKRQPTLYLVATPIGNQQEITQRALDILNEVDVIAAEDTRHSGQLLKGYGISKPFLSHHEHNQSVSIPKILHHLEQGDSVALISDAGYPVISDPGNQLVQSVIQQGFAVVPVSGANAGINALVASGLDASHYLFYGFLNAKSSKRKKELASLKECPYTLIFYEAPHRIRETLTDMLDVLSDRHMCLARELTKMHEEMIYGTISEVLDVCEELKGEMVLVLEGQTKKESVDWDALVSLVRASANTMPANQAIKQVAKEYGVSKNVLYKKVLEDK